MKPDEIREHAIADADKMRTIRRKWRSIANQEDSGSYCENSSPRYKAVSNVIRLANELASALENIETNFT